MSFLHDSIFGGLGGIAKALPIIVFQTRTQFPVGAFSIAVGAVDFLTTRDLTNYSVGNLNTGRVVSAEDFMNAGSPEQQEFCK